MPQMWQLIDVGIAEEASQKSFQCASKKNLLQKTEFSHYELRIIGNSCLCCHPKIKFCQFEMKYFFKRPQRPENKIVMKRTKSCLLSSSQPKPLHPIPQQ